MSILSQIGVIVLIAVIIFILIRSNRQLAEAAEEGEHFVDEWALREERRKLLTTSRFQAGDHGRKNHPINREFHERDDTEEAEPEEPENITPVYREPEVDISFIELDENRKPVRKIPVKRVPFTIGRAPDNDLVIDDLCIAKKHCRLVSKNGSLILLDEGSRNKLAVGGTLQAETVLADHLRIGIGSREYLVEIKERDYD